MTSIYLFPRQKTRSVFSISDGYGILSLDAASLPVFSLELASVFLKFRCICHQICSLFLLDHQLSRYYRCKTSVIKSIFEFQRTIYKDVVLYNLSLDSVDNNPIHLYCLCGNNRSQSIIEFLHVNVLWPNLALNFSVIWLTS